MQNDCPKNMTIYFKTTEYFKKWQLHNRFKHSVFPNDLQTAIIYRYTKQDVKQNAVIINQSKLSNVAKIFEKRIVQQLETYLERMKYSYNNKLTSWL